MMLRARHLLLLAPLVGCFPEERPALPVPTVNPQAIATQPPHATPPKPKRPRASGASSSSSYGGSSDGLGVAPGAIAPGTEGASTAPNSPERDLPEELRALISNPSACFAKRTAGSGPGSLNLSVSATVTPSGIVNRATVSGATLSAEETACLEAMVERAHFKSPVEGAPTTVQATVELREQAPAKKATEPTSPAATP